MAIAPAIGSCVAAASIAMKPPRLEPLTHTLAPIHAVDVAEEAHHPADVPESRRAHSVL